jgi:hypothetical protein
MPSAITEPRQSTTVPNTSNTSAFTLACSGFKSVVLLSPTALNEHGSDCRAFSLGLAHDLGRTFRGGVYKNLIAGSSRFTLISSLLRFPLDLCPSSTRRFLSNRSAFFGAQLATSRLSPLAGPWRVTETRSVSRDRDRPSHPIYRLSRQLGTVANSIRSSESRQPGPHSCESTLR